MRSQLLATGVYELAKRGLVNALTSLGLPEPTAHPKRYLQATD